MSCPSAVPLSSSGCAITTDRFLGVVDAQRAHSVHWVDGVLCAAASGLLWCTYPSFWYTLRAPPGYTLACSEHPIPERFLQPRPLSAAGVVRDVRGISRDDLYGTSPWLAGSVPH